MHARLSSHQPAGLIAVLLAVALLLAACQPATTSDATLQPNTAPQASNTSAPTLAAPAAGS